MDSRPETLKHISEVQRLMLRAIGTLIVLALNHDLSKLKEPEKSILDQFTPLLATTTYGSQEYKDTLKAMKPMLEHHYANNTHHPEFFQNGIRDMTLFDLTEMLCDWMAASRRHDDGDVFKSVEINQDRFGYSDELKEILINTIDFLDLFENSNIK